MLKQISLFNFRNYQDLCLNTDSDSIVLYGDNGQGKTNFLEAVYYLAFLRSFRISSIRSLKRITTNGFYVSGLISLKNCSWDRKIEVEYINNRRRLKIDNLPVRKSADFIRYIKPVIFSYEDINIITGSSKLRRRYIDIFISSIDYEYFSALREYTVALKSRNALLKNNDPEKSKMIAAFEPILASNAVKIIKRRYEYIEKLKEKTLKFLNEIKCETLQFDIKYLTKINYDKISEDEILDRLEMNRSKDIKNGFTGTGPHSEDLDFIYNKKSLRYYGSLGQCRTVSLCLKMSELNLVRKFDSTGNVLALIDDVTGELDLKTKNSFFRTISDADQLIFTLTDSGRSEEYFNKKMKLYVSEGEIKPY